MREINKSLCGQQFFISGCRTLLGLMFTLHVFTSACCQIAITSDNFLYSQNFNSLSNSGNANPLELTGWCAASQPLGVPTAYTTYRTGTGSSSTNGLYSFGTDANDRALGSLNQDDDSEDIVYGVLFQNNAGVAIRSVQLSFHAEQWRRPATDHSGYQRVKVSYAAGNAIPVSANDLFINNNFTELNEAFFMSIDTTSAVSSALDGNIFQATIQVTVPVSILPGQQFFLRFYDENASGADVAMAVDDLDITFFSATAMRITASSSYSVSAYLEMGIVEDISDDPLAVSYAVPQPPDLNSWQIILSSFYQEAWDDVVPGAYGYVLAEFEDQSGQEYFVLRKTNNSGYYWGTYAIAANPANDKLVLQASHPIDDQSTGRQSTVIFQLTGAKALMIAGIGRCIGGAESLCVGTTSTCSPNAKYRMSDVAHTNNAVFHTATTVLGNLNSARVFLQLHGFSQSPGDKDFYISCGTMNGLSKSVPDYAVLVREHLLNTNSSWAIQITHVDNDETLGARDNVQGRFLNNYPGDICTGATHPSTVTNRFLHIEQYKKVRKEAIFYTTIANAIADAINDTPYVRGIVVAHEDDQYVQNFDTFSSVGATHTWGNNLHLNGWYAVHQSTGLFSTFTINTGSSLTGAIYSYGASGSSDRALGSIASNSIGNIAYGLLLTNATGKTITSINLNYKAEQWRGVSGTPPQRVQLGYTIGQTIDLSPNGILNNTNYTHVTAGDLTTIDDNSAGALDGNTNFNTVNIEVPLVWPSGQEMFIRFYDENDPNSDKAIALDDFNLTFSASSPSPVEWLYFDIVAQGAQALLRWGTANESKCNRLYIQRSLDGINFENIAAIACKRSMIKNSYTFQDEAVPNASKIYYRIAQFDDDGQSGFSNVAMFRPRNQPLAVSFNDGAFHIVTFSDGKIESIMIFDLLGRTLCADETQHENSIRIDCPEASDRIVIVRTVVDGLMQVHRMKTGY